MKKFCLLFLLVARCLLHVEGSPLPDEEEVEDDGEYADGYDENGPTVASDSDNPSDDEEETEDRVQENNSQELGSQTDEEEGAEGTEQETDGGRRGEDSQDSDNEDEDEEADTEAGLRGKGSRTESGDDVSRRQSSEDEDESLDQDRVQGRDEEVAGDEDNSGAGEVGQDNQGAHGSEVAEGENVDGVAGQSGKSASGKKGKGKGAGAGAAGRSAGSSASGGGSGGYGGSNGEESAVHTYQQVMQILDGIQVNAPGSLNNRLVNGLHSLKHAIIGVVVHIQKFSTIEHCFGNLAEIVQLYAGDAVERYNQCQGTCIETVSNDFTHEMHDMANRLIPCLQGGFY